MIESETLIGALIAALLFILTQFTKEALPEFMSKYGKWVALTFGSFGAAIMMIIYLANNGGNIVASNTWEAIIVMLQEAIKGFSIGVAPVGIYFSARPLIPSTIRSSDEILVARTPATMSGEVAVPVTTVETNVETVSVTDEATVTLKSKKAKKA